MRRIVAIIGWLLILGAVLVFLGETYEWLDTGDYHVTATGELWFHLSPGSLNLLQAGVQRHITPLLWDDLLRPFLLLPAWLVLGVPGIAILVLRRRRHRRKRTLVSR
ncbi:MAG: hypothetical protein ACHQF3_08520 [Alphaproteobacteria bacterium]